VFKIQDDIELLTRSIFQLEDLFLLVVIGEFNSGKSSFLNAFLGKNFLKEGLTPTTSKVGILRYGDKVRIYALSW
jgi:GTP-binding protein EngB required for normal cell division